MAKAFRRAQDAGLDRPRELLKAFAEVSGREARKHWQPADTLLTCWRDLLAPGMGAGAGCANCCPPQNLQCAETESEPGPRPGRGRRGCSVAG